MSERQDFLVEIGTEELPPRALATLSAHFCDEIARRLADTRLEHGAIHAFATPRRLAVRVDALAVRQPEQTTERRGPAVAAAFDAQGQPTGAALGFARSCGVPFEALSRTRTDMGEWLCHRARAAGRSASALLPALVEAALAALPIPKRMRWGDGDVEFVRPVHWVVMLLGESVVPGRVLGIEAGRTTRGHRFMGSAAIALDRPAEYASRLEREGRVIADFAGRRARVREEIERAAAASEGRALIEEALLDEVTALVEWPSAVVGSFDAHFLEVPREVLIATMQGNQKYFPLEDAQGRLLNRFITIANIESPAPELVRAGNERVIRPRLADAAFFWNKDRKTRLAARVPLLGDIVFERRLGSLLAKTGRVERLAATLAADFGADPALAARAARLSRCDLLSEMVGEFPELQGTMGACYARHDGEDEAVARALGEFYLPRFAGDTIPASAPGRCVALAEKLDTLVGIFGIGATPSGDKDPYALRRAALGGLRIVIEGESPLDLAAALAAAEAGFEQPFAEPVATRVFDFIMERARGYFADRGIRADIIEAVLVTRPAQPLDCARRIAAVEHFAGLPESQALAEANKRITNILRKAETAVTTDVNPALLREPAEAALGTRLAGLERDTLHLLAAGDYRAYLARLAELRDAVGTFFDTVMVMAEDPVLRANRLALLARIHGLFMRVADISLVAS